MEGKDLALQEAHEEGFDRQLFDSMDSVDRRDKRDHIRSSASSRAFVNNYGNIDWNKK